MEYSKLTPYQANQAIYLAHRRGERLKAVYGVFVGEQCVYVGQSNRPRIRMMAHVGRVRRAVGSVPTKRIILEIVARDLAGKTEQKWIRYFDAIGQAKLNKNGKRK